MSLAVSSSSASSRLSPPSCSVSSPKRSASSELSTGLGIDDLCDVGQRCGRTTRKLNRGDHLGDPFTLFTTSPTLSAPPPFPRHLLRPSTSQNSHTPAPRPFHPKSIHQLPQSLLRAGNNIHEDSPSLVLAARLRMHCPVIPYLENCYRTVRALHGCQVGKGCGEQLTDSIACVAAARAADG